MSTGLPANPYATLASNIFAYIAGKTRISPRSWNFNALSQVNLANFISLGAGLTGSTRSAAVGLPQYCKIPKILVAYEAIDVFDGTETFNIVVESAGDYNSAAANGSDARILSATPFGQGSGYQASYTAGAVHTTPDGDNSETRGSPAGQGFGYPTNFAAVGNCLFAKDVPFSKATFTNVAAGTGGGSAVLVPTNWDAVFAAGTILSLRPVTTASTGSVTGLLVALIIQTVDKLAAQDRPIPCFNW